MFKRNMDGTPRALLKSQRGHDAQVLVAGMARGHRMICAAGTR